MSTKVPELLKQRMTPEEMNKWKTIHDKFKAKQKASPDTTKVGLSLTGGGSKGRWQIGFMARVAETGMLDFVKEIAGTSVGGLNGLIIGQDYKVGQRHIDSAVEVWKGITGNSSVFNGTLPSGFWSGLKMLLFGGINKNPGILDTTPLHKLADKLFGAKPASLLDIPVRIVTVDRVTRQKVVSDSNWYMKDMALSTSCVPVAFPPYKETYFDGGLLENNPAMLLVEDGYDIIINMFCEPDKSNMRPSVPGNTVVVNLLRSVEMLSVLQEDALFEQLELEQRIRKMEKIRPVIVDSYWPRQETGNFLDFSSLHLLQRGYDDAVKMFTPEKMATVLGVTL